MPEVDTSQLEEMGQRIAAARRAAGLTQGELAEGIGTSLGRVDRYELGRSDPSEHLERVAKVTRRSMRWLLTGSDLDETDEAMLAALGRRVQEARHAAGLTESELAAKLGVDEEKVARYESGQDDVSTVLDSIAQATGSSRAWLRGETDEPDELDRLFSALAQQRDETKQRQAELDRLEQEFRLRQSDLEERELLIRRQREEFEQEAEQRLRELEELHRNVVASAHGFADRAAELRRTQTSGASEPEDAAPEEHEQEPAPSV
ncbi:MAG TPA: helix-turn-helix domain-containing protein [Gaiellaceae bacterium]